MKRIITSVAATLLLFSVSASADVAQVWQCQLADGKTNDDVLALSETWLAAAKEVDANARVRIYYPIAGDSVEGSFVWVFYVSDFTSWGKFEDAYPDSAVAAIDVGWNEVSPCENVSDLYATVDVE